MSSSLSTLVVHNARIYTVDGRTSPATALALRDGRFLAVGTASEVSAAAPEARHVDAEGRFIVPGFIDAHAHLEELGLALRRADLTGAASPEAIVDRLRAFVADRELPDGAWLRGHGWDETKWPPPRRPTRHRLDDAFPDRPV